MRYSDIMTSSEFKSLVSPGLAGVSGEYFAAAELSRKGYIASITLRNTKGVDILCTTADIGHQIGIQVKTNRGSNREWILNNKIEKLIDDNLFYIFVNLHGDNTPDYFIVPSHDVVTQARESHEKYLAKPGRNGEAHKDTTMRKFIDPDGNYLNRWDLLNSH